jgi:hypothetical protein
MEYNEDMLRGLRWMLDEANNRGLKMMLTLTNGQPMDYGGIRQYYRYSHTRVQHKGRLCTLLRAGPLLAR